MRFVIFTHSLVSDWNHGNAHFLRGIASELLSRGHRVDIYEPDDGWSRHNLLEDCGQKAIDDFHGAFPQLFSQTYNEHALDLSAVLRHADIVIVHEWNSHSLVERIGNHRKSHDYLLYFHDTHHRSLTDPAAMAQYDLRHFDGVLAYGRVIRDCYLRNGWTKNAWTWHEAADTRIFTPLPRDGYEGDLVWIGNWGDDERADTLREYLLHPVKTLALRAKIYGVRYPDSVLEELREAGIEYGGWLPNHKVPQVFSRYRVTVHVPRGPYVEALSGIPTIRPFEALACGIPLISAPWHDSERLFTPGEDFLFAHSGAEMISQLELALSKPDTATRIANHGLETILQRHTCEHRVDELFSFIESPEFAAAARGQV